MPLAALAVFVLAASLNLWRISEGLYIVDERAWISEGEVAFELFSEADFEHPWWSGLRNTFGYPSSNVPKLLIGLALRSRGLAAERGAAETARPAPRVLAAARLPSALAGALGVTSLFLIARRIAGPRIALGAAVLLMSSPVWLAMSRVAMSDVYAVAFWLLAVLLLVRACERVGAPGRLPASLAGFAATGCALGLSVGSRFTAGGPAIGLGLFALAAAASALRSSRASARREVFELALGGTLMTAVAVAVFVGAHPHLHEAPLRRTLEILELWQAQWGSRADGSDPRWSAAYSPGTRSFAELGFALLLPALPALCALVPALIGAGWHRFARRGRELDPDVVRIRLWSLAVPALALAALLPSRVVLSWIGWVGLVGAILCVWIPGERSARARAALVPFAAATLGALWMTLRSTHISWPKYYLPLVPFVCLVAASGLEGLLRSLFRGGRSAAGLCMAAAVAAGLLVVPAGAPDYVRGSMGLVAERIGEAALAPGLQIAAAACLLLVPVLGLRTADPGRRGAAPSADPPR